MATLREIRGRIVGVKKTQKITKAMKMVAAAKLRRAQRNVVQARPYATKIKQLLNHLYANPVAADHALIQPRTIQAVALIVVTSDRGFCGAFNSNLIKTTERLIDTDYKTLHQQGKVKLFCIGKKGADHFSKRGYSIAGKYIGVYSELVFGTAQRIAREVIGEYTKGEFDRVDIICNVFKSAAQQTAITEQFLPIAGVVTEGESADSIDYIYEPSDTAIIDALIPKHLNFQLWRLLLESNAAEEAARMAAMENATTNANDLINYLQLSYNKARQAAITSELLEIVGGAEALKKTG